MVATNPKPQVSDSFEQPAAAKPARPAGGASAGNAGLDWLEQGFGQRRCGDDAAKKAKEAEEEKTQKEQLVQLQALDKKRSREMYEEIQRQIRLIRKKKAAQPPKSVTGAAGYNPEQQQKPESFKEKLKKTILPWTSKQGMGTGEITRGVSG